MRIIHRMLARTLAGAGLALLPGILLTPGRADAQFTTISVGNIRENAPIFTESAVVLQRGGISIGGYGAWFMVDEEEFLGELADDVDVTAYQLGGAIAFGVTDAITVGATLPYFNLSLGEEDLNGILDLDVFARARLWSSANQATKLAALASVILPTASEDFVGEDVDRSASFSIGGAVTHDARRASLHGSVEYLFAGEESFEDVDFEGTDVLSFSGAAVFSAADNLRLIGEFDVDILQSDDGFEDELDEEDTFTSIAGGLRYLASPNLFIDGGVLVPLTQDEITAVLLAGVTWTR